MRALKFALAIALAFGLLLGLGALVALSPAQAAPAVPGRAD